MCWDAISLGLVLRSARTVSLLFCPSAPLRLLNTNACFSSDCPCPCWHVVSAWGRRVHGDPAEPAYYYTLPYRMHEELKQATTELHKMFLEATRHVLATPALWPAFAFPASFWPRAQASFARADHLVCGRFDFCLQMATGVFKAFEYNADSASCLLECGLSQGKWGEAVGLVGAVGTYPPFVFEVGFVVLWVRAAVSWRCALFFDD